MKIRISLMGGFEEKTHQDYLRHLCQGRVWRWRWQTFLPPFFSNLMMVEVFLFTFHCCPLVKLQNNFSELQLCATCCFAGSGKRVNATGRDAGKKNVCCATSVVCSRLTSLHQMSCSTDMKDTIPTKAENTIVLNKYYGFHLQEWNEAAVGNRSLQIDLLQP